MRNQFTMRKGSFMLVAICLLLMLSCWTVCAQDMDEFDEDFSDFDDFVDEEDEIENMNLHEQRESSKQDLENDFVTDETLQNKPKVINKPKIISSAKATSSLSEDFEIKTYAMEIFGIILSIAFGLNYLRGRWINSKLANEWINIYGDFLLKHFYACGMEGNMSTTTCTLEQQSPCLFSAYSSGRKNCTGMLCEIHLKKRQDLFALLYSLVYPEYDVVNLEIPMNDSDMDSFIFSILRKRDQKTIEGKFPELIKLAKNVPLELLPKELCCMTDNIELVTPFLSSAVVKVLTQCKDYFGYIHMSDQCTTSAFGITHENISAKALKLQFRMPSSGDMKEMEALMTLAIRLIDLVGHTKLSSKAKSKATKLRSALNQSVQIEQNQQRIEAMEQRKLAKKKKEDEMFNNLSREQQRKKEAEKNRRELKKRQRKGKIMLSR